MDAAPLIFATDAEGSNEDHVGGSGVASAETPTDWTEDAIQEGHRPAMQNPDLQSAQAEIS